MRYKVTIEYDGSCFSGWQKQKHCSNSIQESIENAISKFTNEKIFLYAAGRTDSGVHAVAQVAHFDLTITLKEYVIRNAINYHLRPLPISITKVEHVSDDFHARFSAVKRHYEYRILNRYAPSALNFNRVWHVCSPLNVIEMQKASQYFIGTHDFSSFRSKHCQAESPLKTIDEIEVLQISEYIYVKVSALSFLHNQVRIIVGTLVECGKGFFSSERIKSIINNADRREAGITAPPYGLYLMKVDY